MPRSARDFIRLLVWMHEGLACLVKATRIIRQQFLRARESGCFVASRVAPPRPFNVYGITDDWDPDTLPEDQITWNNAPRTVNSSVVLFEQSPGVPLLIAGYDFMLGGDYDQDDDGIDDDGTPYAFDLTDYINERIENDADGKVTILIGQNNPTGANLNTSVFFSKENVEECARPFLRLE